MALTAQTLHGLFVNAGDAETVDGLSDDNLDKPNDDHADVDNDGWVEDDAVRPATPAGNARFGRRSARTLRGMSSIERAALRDGLATGVVRSSLGDDVAPTPAAVGLRPDNASGVPVSGVSSGRRQRRVSTTTTSGATVPTSVAPSSAQTRRPNASRGGMLRGTRHPRNQAVGIDSEQAKRRRGSRSV